MLFFNNNKLKINIIKIKIFNYKDNTIFNKKINISLENIKPYEILCNYN